MLLAYYSFFVIWESQQPPGAYQNIFMNSTALLFLNDLDDYVCGIVKIYIRAREEPLFLVMTITQLKGDGIAFDP